MAKFFLKSTVMAVMMQAGVAARPHNTSKRFPQPSNLCKRNQFRGAFQQQKFSTMS